MTSAAKIAAMREMLETTRRNIQLVDVALADLSRGRIPVVPAHDVSSEHRAAWLGAVDDLDGEDGISLGRLDLATSYGFNNVKTGTIRNQEDAAFVVTDVLVAVAAGTADSPFSSGFQENEYTYLAALDIMGAVPMLRLRDGSSGRSLIEGNNAQINGGSGLGMGGALEAGFVPFSAIGAFRPGLGAVYKNALFSEFTLPRKATVKAEVVNAGVAGEFEVTPALIRACVTLLGYKVYGA